MLYKTIDKISIVLLKEVVLTFNNNEVEEISYDIILFENIS